MASVDTCEIAGVLLVRLQGHGDERGRFMETFRQEWFPDAPPMVQGNRSDSVARDAARPALPPAPGRLLVRPDRDDPRRPPRPARERAVAPGASLAFEIGEDNETGVYIPPGVAHGFQAVTDATLTYLVDNYYDPNDENGLAWDDPDAAIPWPIPEPLLSDRDKVNPKRSDIPKDRLPS